jgi:hypothetical protein
MTNPETGEATDGQVETIIKAGLGRLTWPAALVQPAVGWSLQRMGDGIELRDAHGGPWVRCAVRLEPRWISAAVSWGQVLVVYGVRLGSGFRPTRETAARALPSGGRNYSRRDGRASWLLVRTLDHTLAETQSPDPIGPCGNADSVRCRSVDSTQGSRRAHLYHEACAHRCADQHFSRSPATVDRQVMCSSWAPAGSPATPARYQGCLRIADWTQ